MSYNKYTSVIFDFALFALRGALRFLIILFKERLVHSHPERAIKWHCIIYISFLKNSSLQNCLEFETQRAVRNYCAKKSKCFLDVSKHLLSSYYVLQCLWKHVNFSFRSFWSKGMRLTFWVIWGFNFLWASKIFCDVKNCYSHR